LSRNTTAVTDNTANAIKKKGEINIRKTIAITESFQIQNF